MVQSFAHIVLLQVFLPFAVLLVNSAFLPSNLTVSNSSVAHNNISLYKPLYEPHLNSTPKFVNISGETANPLVIALLPAKDANPVPASSAKRSALFKRDLPVGTCAPGTPW
jgi:chitinase